MKIYFRTFNVDEKEHSLTSRFWTDAISEDDLATSFTADASGARVIQRRGDGSPLNCRTDTRITIYDPSWNKDQIIEHVKRHAPAQWFKLQQASNPNLSSLHEHSDSFDHIDPVGNANLTEEEIQKLVTELSKQ